MSIFVNRAWYMAGWGEEFGEQPLSRQVAGRKLLLLRASSGEAVIMDDRCPHRFAPLSLGSRDGDKISCPYHGLMFDLTGTCVRNPFSNKIPAGARVPTYPVVERDGIVWIWMGEADAADPGLAPDFSMLAPTPFTNTIHGYMPMQANYEYGTDNLMDLSHIEFVHKGSFAGRGVIFAGQHEFREDGEALWSNWWMPRVPTPGHAAAIYPPDMITDHWLDMRWHAPASMQLEIGATPTGQPREQGVIVQQAHILTPETKDTTHYFWASTYGSPPGGPDMGPMVRSVLEKAFAEEDKPIIEAAYANRAADGFWANRPIALGIDAGGVKARRAIEAKLRAEGGDKAVRAAE